MSTWPILLLEVGLALTVLYLSKKQPFPRTKSSTWMGFIVCRFVVHSWRNSTKASEHTRFHYAVLLILGAIGLVKGINNMLIIRQEVLVAPICGILFCVGAVGFMSEEWQNMTSFEQIFSFLTVVVLAGGEVWLVFRGLLIGRLPLAWSQAGLVALRRGVISGEHGAIWCFERAWDLTRNTSTQWHGLLWKESTSISEMKTNTHIGLRDYLNLVAKEPSQKSGFQPLKKVLMT